MSDDFFSLFRRSLEGLKEHLDIVRELINSAPDNLYETEGQGQPGYVIPYELPEEEAPEIPLTPVTKYAIQETAAMGPLTEKKLILLLSERFDRRLKRTADVILGYSDDVHGVKYQLENLGNQIQEIETVENLRREFLHKRIRKVLAAIRHFKDPEAVPEEETNVPDHEQPDIEQFEEVFTPAAKLAVMECGKMGPLNEESFIKLLCERITNNWENNLPIIWQYTKDGEGLKKQFELFRDYMDGIDGMERLKTNFLLEQVKKALADLEEELY